LIETQLLLHAFYVENWESGVRKEQKMAIVCTNLWSWIYLNSCSRLFSDFADVTETLLVEVDQIYHLACPASPIFYKYNPVKVCICCPFICVYMCRYVQNFKELYSLQLLSSPGSPPSFESKMSCCSSHSLPGWHSSCGLVKSCCMLQTIKTNVMGTLNMLGLAKRVGARCVICFLFGLWPFCLTCSVWLDLVLYASSSIVILLKTGNMCSIIVVTSGLLKGYVQGVEDSKHYPLCSTFYSFGLLSCTGAS